MVNEWKQKCVMCKKWFNCSHNSREYCFECNPKLYVDEVKPLKEKYSFKENVIILLQKISKATRSNRVKNLIEEFQDDNAEILFTK